MKHRLMLIAAVTAWLVGLPCAANAQKLVIVIRHAERADAGMAAQETDPLLSAAGTARAARMVSVLGDAGIKAIYVTQYRRTQDTAKPLATKLNIRVEQTPPSNEALVRQLRSRHANDVVLMVGHTNTIPAIIRALGGPDVTIADNEFDSIFIIAPATKAMTRIHY